MGLGLFDKNMDFGEGMGKECQNGNSDFPQGEKGTCASCIELHRQPHLFPHKFKSLHSNVPILMIQRNLDTKLTTASES